ncbi:MAG: hypothetical protein Q7U91_04070 [Sideroxyarcus sp.]|nr:hypothetical protein [Sideroxyarcus sp.]
MKEHRNVRQIPGESKRRWFHSENFDLIVWLSDDQDFVGFELCYDKLHHEHSISWNPSRGFAHMAVDDGEHRPGKYKASPVLVADGAFDGKRVYSAFLKVSPALPREIAVFVLQALRQHPSLGR